MNKSEQKVYFSAQALKSFVAAEQKVIKTVICYLWHNAINKEEIVELIYGIEFAFADNSRLNLGSNNDNTGLEVIDFNFEAEKKNIENEYAGKIKLFAVNASFTKMWEEVIGKKLNTIQLTKQNENYLSDSILLNFGEERRIVSISPLDGLVIDFYEED